jgi:hypothetical protein
MTNAADLFPVTKGGAGAGVPLYASVTLVSAAIIALQLAIMRIFAVGSWSHFGSLVVSLAMLGFEDTILVLALYSGSRVLHGNNHIGRLLIAIGADPQHACTIGYRVHRLDRVQN